MDGGIRLYQERLGLWDATFSRIDHEDAMVALVYLVTKADGVRLILKVHERANDYLREVYFLKRLHGHLPVPKIVGVVEPVSGVHGAILMECLPGGLLQAREFIGSLAYEIGQYLARIHLHRMPGFGDPVQGGLNADPRIYFTFKFEEGLQECRGHLPDLFIERCHEYYNQHLNLLKEVDGPCIVHRDFRPGNLIIENGKLQGVIDWAGARLSFAEEDFCALEHGEWPSHSEGKDAFLEGYASIRPVPAYDKFMLLLRLAKAIATIGFIVKRGNWNGRHARLYQNNRRFLDELFKL